MADGDLRMLGACDGFAHALIRVRQEISEIDGIYAPPIHPLHTRKRQSRDDKLRPLREVERWLKERHRLTLDAYNRTVTKA